MDAMRDAGCDAVVLLGQVPRQDPRNLNLDAGGVAMVPALLAAAPKGDDALLRAVLAEHERAGFRVLGADEVMQELLAPTRRLGRGVANAVAAKGHCASGEDSRRHRFL
jgi:DUF1009 family protein